MAAVGDYSPLEILHIRADTPPRTSPNPAVQAVEGKLAAASVDTRVITDVYRALALLCPAGPGNLDEASGAKAVIVCVDDLGPAELEFFVVLRRVRPDLPVYVYGMEHLTSHVDRAMEFGATGRFTDRVIRSLAFSRGAEEIAAPERTGQPDAPADLPPGGETHHSGAPLEDLPERRAAAETADVRDSRERESSDDGSVELPVRVPWLRYADSPKRVGPLRPPPAHSEPPSDQEGDEERLRGRSSEPLLTDAELEALVGGEVDDISAIAPEQDDEGNVDERIEGKGEV